MVLRIEVDLPLSFGRQIRFQELVLLVLFIEPPEDDFSRSVARLLHELVHIFLKV